MPKIQKELLESILYLYRDGSSATLGLCASPDTSCIGSALQSFWIRRLLKENSPWVPRSRLVVVEFFNPPWLKHELKA